MKIAKIKAVLTIESLTDEERELLQNLDFSFLGKDSSGECWGYNISFAKTSYQKLPSGMTIDSNGKFYVRQADGTYIGSDRHSYMEDSTGLRRI